MSTLGIFLEAVWEGIMFILLLAALTFAMNSFLRLAWKLIMRWEK